MKKGQIIYHFAEHWGQSEKLQRLCGIADENLDELERLLAVKLILRGRAMTIKSSDEKKLRLAYTFFSFIEKLEPPQQISNQSDWYRIYADIQKTEGFSHSLLPPLEEQNQDTLQDSNKKERNTANAAKESDTGKVSPIFVSHHHGREIFAKTKAQQDLVESLLSQTLTICLGPAGSGKTFLSIAVACKLLANRKRERLILTRPAVEAGESLGFLPGDLQQKIDPYLRPLSDALVECLGQNRLNKMLESGEIEILPLAYMRGRTLGDAVVILDEAQNCTIEQLKMFLTRMGYRSSFFINGDTTQVDIQLKKSGLENIAKKMTNISQIGIHRLSYADINRHPLVKTILSRLE